LGALSASATVLTFTWRNTPLDSDVVGVNGASNWDSTVNRSPQSADNADLVFQASGTTNLSFSTSLNVNGISFGSGYSAYTFSSSASRTLGLGAGGLTTVSNGTGTITFASTLALQLKASQTWSNGGPVTVNSVISADSTGYLLTKTGSGILTLTGANTFDGGFTLSTGTVVLGSSTSGSTGPVGTGTLTLANNTILAAASSSTVTLGNHVHLSGTSVYFGTSSATGKLIFTGEVEFQQAGTTTVQTAGADVRFNGELEASGGSAQVVFRGSNTFALGGTVKTNVTGISAGSTSGVGRVLFASSLAVHSNLSISGGADSSYVGVGGSDFTTTTGLAAFLAQINTRSSFKGMLGFDSPTASTLTYVGGTSNALDLSAFTSADFAGISSSSSAILSSAMVITAPTSGILKLSGSKGGILTVQAPLTSANSVTQVKLSSDSFDGTSSTVILSSGASNYTGGTSMQTGYFLFGASSTVSGSTITSGPFGTGTVAVGGDESAAFLSSTTSGSILHNPITVASGSPLRVGFSSSVPSAVSSLANNTFQLSGVISGSGAIRVHNQNGTVTLSGANTYTGGTNLASAAVVASSASAFGAQTGALYFSGSSVLTVSTATLSAGSIDSDTGTSSTISLGANSLAIYQNNAGTYRGTITGSGSVSKHNAGTLTFANATSYTGGTTVHSGKVILASGATLGASSSAITLNNGASLILNSGASLSNPLTLNSGSSIGGAGTFATAISVGSGVTLSPGTSPGTMTFSNGLTFASGGTLAFEINNATGTAGAASGWDLLSISGALAVTATSGSPFTVQIKSLDADNLAASAANFSAANNYAWTFASATGGITGFDTTKFTLDRSAFSNTSAGQFFLSQSGNNLVLNFTPVPEPSTYVLMGTGLSLLAASALRRRRRSDKSP
jgi:autotransporter-associated beta strand protein